MDSEKNCTFSVGSFRRQFKGFGTAAARRACDMISDPQNPLPFRKQRRVLETITVERPRCPRCGGVLLRKYRSIRDQGDGSALYY